MIDDHSEDQTANIARSLGAKVVSSEALHEGWTGKTWACWQGAQVAREDILFFLDADTWLENDGLSKALSIFLQNGSNPLSILPWHKTKTLFEQASLFFNIMMATGVLGKGRLCGQSLMLKRADYFDVGGHKSVSSEILENLFLAVKFREHGLAPNCQRGENILSFRMYQDDLSGLMDGWIKAFARGVKEVPVLRMASSIVWTSGLFLAFFNLVFSFKSGFPWLSSSILFYCAFCLQLSWISKTIGNFWLVPQIFYPIPLVFFQCVFFVSKKKQILKNHVTWKGRNVPHRPN